MKPSQGGAEVPENKLPHWWHFTNPGLLVEGLTGTLVEVVLVVVVAIVVVVGGGVGGLV